MIAAIYARKSTEQAGVAEEEKSIARQVDHARTYAAAKGWVVADDQVYVDDGISGAEFANRPGFLRLMNALKPRPRFQVLVMSEESRLGREAIETAYALKQLVTAGVRVFFYLEDRERTLNSPIEKAMLSLQTMADEMERERARQRTYDAMLRKAKAHHVTGGRVFGYDNVDVAGAADASGRAKRSHVIRQINETEAAIVRRMFQLCADGLGKIRIAKLLNEEGAPAPRSQQGRPHAWAASSVREVLYRELYRGVIVWNKSQKRNAWGQKRAHERPERDWVRVEAPELRIVPEDLWGAVHARLSAARDVYLRRTDGRLWGRPLNGVDAKYLLTGLARCANCGGSLEVRSRSHGRRREFYYACSSYWRRGKAVCANKIEIDMEAGDAAVLEAIEDGVLDADVIREVVDTALAELSTPETGITERVQALTGELATVETELSRLSSAIASGGQVDALLDAVKERDTRRKSLRRQIGDLEAHAVAVAAGPGPLEATIYERLKDWRGLLRRHVPQARQIIAKLLEDRLTFAPETRDGVAGFRIRGCGSFLKFLDELVPSVSQAMASPTGFEPVFWP